MIQRIKGTVTKASKGKFSYFLLLDGNDFYYNTKFEPKCGEGDVVGIEFEPKGPTRGNVKRIKILEDNSGGYEKSNSQREWGGGGSSSKSSGGGVSNDGRQASIVWQHSQEMAVNFADILVEKGAFTLAGSAGDKYEQMLALVDDLTVKFYKDALDPSKSKAMKASDDFDEDMGEEKEEKKSSGDEWDEGDWD